MAEVVWKTSPWDHHAHAFGPDGIGEVVAEALCEHSCRASALTEPGEAIAYCLACLLLHGNDLATENDQQSVTPEWS